MSNKTAGSHSIVPSPGLLHFPIPACVDHPGVVKARVKADPPRLPKGGGAQGTCLCELQVERHWSEPASFPNLWLLGATTGIGSVVWAFALLWLELLLHVLSGKREVELRWQHHEGAGLIFWWRKCWLSQLPSWAGFWPEGFNHVTQRESEWGLYPFSHFSLFMPSCWQRAFPPVGHHRAFLGSGLYGEHLELMGICHSSTEAPLLLVSISGYRGGRWRKNMMKR